MGSPYQATAEQLRSVANGSITNSYAAFGTPLVNPSRILHFINTTDADMLISIDGTNPYFVIPAGAGTVYDLCSNRQGNDYNFCWPAHSQFYVKYVSAPTKGSIYLVTIYGNSGS